MSVLQIKEDVSTYVTTQSAVTHAVVKPDITCRQTNTIVQVSQPIIYFIYIL